MKVFETRFTKRMKVSMLIFISLITFKCSESILDVYPEDKITSEIIPQNEDDIRLLLNGIYAQLRETSIYDQGFLGFGALDGASPNGYNWGSTGIARAGNGSLTASTGELVTYRWTRSYSIIYRANYFLSVLDKVDLSDDARATYIGEAHFLRGFAYSILADGYGGVPLIDGLISAEESRNLSRSTLQETWNKVIEDYDIAIANLDEDAPQVGRATKGAALGMKMRAYLYQNRYTEVLNMVQEIEDLGKYSLFPSYQGLFTLVNENNQEVLFDVQYIRGENSQGSSHDQFCGLGTYGHTRGNRYNPTPDLVAAYEMIDGSAIVPDDPYTGRDPRLEFTVVRPGAYFAGALYPTVAFNHPSNRGNFAFRKYRIEPEEDIPPAHQSDLNYIVLRYADVILAKAEAMIELNQDIPGAIALINQIRTQRDDVTMYSLPTDLTQSEARDRLRFERRIEFAGEGLYWSDVRRWDIGDELYPLEVRGRDGVLLETKFPNGYLDHYNLLPIPQDEIALNPNLVQNEGW